MTVKLIEKLVDFDTAPGGDLIIKQSQWVPDEFLSDLRRERDDSLSTPAGEMHRVCSIPTGVVDKWMQQGFDVHREPISEILKRLRKEQLDGFITTNKVY
jgi:hypothetical protein